MTSQNARAFLEHVERVGEAYAREFPGERLDAEWSATGYSDLPAAVQAVYSWQEYHDAVEEYLSEFNEAFDPIRDGWVGKDGRP